MSHNKSVLDDTLTELKSKLEENPKEQFDFGKMYKSHLQQLYSAGDKIDENTTRWIVIPSKINDSEHFLDNVKRLQTLSHDNWCTKAKGADLYLKDGDFHIYFEKGKPKIALRFVDDEIREIQGVNNDRIIQPEYIDSPVLSCLCHRCKLSDWGFGHLYASLRYLEFCCHKNIFFKRFRKSL